MTPTIHDTTCLHCGEKFRALVPSGAYYADKINEYAHCDKVECIIRVKYNVWKENPFVYLSWVGRNFEENVEYYDKEYGHVFKEVVGDNWKTVLSKVF